MARRATSAVEFDSVGGLSDMIQSKVNVAYATVAYGMLHELVLGPNGSTAASSFRCRCENESRPCTS